MLLRLLLFGFTIRVALKASKKNKLERPYLLFGILMIIAVFILNFPPVFPNSQQFLYPIKFAIFFVLTAIHVSSLGYLSARADKQFTTQQREILQLANTNEHLLINQKAILEQQVAERTLKLQQSNTLKDKLFATIGHDLRNAVIILKTSLHLFDSKKQGNTQQIQKQVDDLYSILDNLLEWSILQLYGVPH